MNDVNEEGNDVAAFASATASATSSAIVTAVVAVAVVVVVAVAVHRDYIANSAQLNWDLAELGNTFFDVFPENCNFPLSFWNLVLKT